MSRIGKKPVEIPAKVKVTVSGDKITAEGPLGTLSIVKPAGVNVEVDDKHVTATIPEDRAEDRELRALWGTTRALVQNIVKGVSEGYERTMEVVGVGWNAQVQGQQLKLALGFANPIMMPIPPGLDVSVDRQFVKIKGTDKQQVGQFAAAMRAKRKPEPYNGKGVKYANEVIRRKQGKSFGS